MKRLISLLCIVLISGCDKQLNKYQPDKTDTKTANQVSPSPSPSPLPNMKDLPTRAKGIAWQTWDWAKAHGYIIATVVQVAVLALLAYKYIYKNDTPLVPPPKQTTLPEDMPAVIYKKQTEELKAENERLKQQLTESAEYKEYLAESLGGVIQKADEFKLQSENLKEQVIETKEFLHQARIENELLKNQDKALVTERNQYSGEASLNLMKANELRRENKQLRGDLALAKPKIQTDKVEEPQVVALKITQIGWSDPINAFEMQENLDLDLRQPNFFNMNEIETQTDTIDLPDQQQQINKLNAEVNHLQKNLNETKELNDKLRAEKAMPNLKALKLNIKNSAAQLALKKKAESLAESNVSLKTANDTLDAQNKQLIDKNEYRMQERKKLMQKRDFAKMMYNELFRENRRLRAEVTPLPMEVVQELSNLQVFEVQEVEELVK
ncbi:hypothetical protein [Candidatus Endomicrobiellum agilis]|uniref:hypothetical protein n=1 Tax=Candidatus Endomicrobiellum agilis TaxID=3238957 RepID=UPI003579448F|nr:hypothetical protein [Endomicrobium sp.]